VESQTQRLRQLGDSLRQHGVELTFEFSTTLHDREIRFAQLAGYIFIFTFCYK